MKNYISLLALAASLILCSSNSVKKHLDGQFMCSFPSAERKALVYSKELGNCKFFPNCATDQVTGP